jgi:hypothetical protein
MWIELLTGLDLACKFTAPAATNRIAEAEKALKVLFPEELKSILLESNGVLGRYDLDLLWNVDRIRQENLTFRTTTMFKDLYMPFDHLLFFADAGNGDQFAYPVLNGKVRRDDIFVWNHEDDSRSWLVPNLRTYFEWCLGTQSET